MPVLKRVLPAVVACGVGLAVLSMLFTPDPWLDTVGTYLIDMAILIAAFALLLGLLNVLRVHIGQIRERGPDQVNSAVLIAAMLVVLLAGLVPFPGQPAGPSRPVVQWIFENIQAPIQASLSALLAFFIISAAYRTLRVRNVESAVMLIVALVVLAGQVLAGLVPILPEVKEWILRVPAVAGVRGILLGAALGTLLTGIRLLVGVEVGRAAMRPHTDQVQRDGS